MAAGSKKPTVDIEFPIYIETDWCEEDTMFRYCYAELGQEGIELRQKLIDYTLANGSDYGGYYSVELPGEIIVVNDLETVFIYVEVMVVDGGYVVNAYGLGNQFMEIYEDGSIMIEDIIM